MKLELKHLAGYLPYGLEVYHKTWIQALIMDCSGATIDSISILDVAEYSKPILRPLSDLTKEIEVNGEKFVPKDIIEELHSSECIRWILCNDIYECKYHVIEKLLEWHFDIYGLIENNLAIDKNTIL